MFDILKQAEDGVATEAVYLAGLRMRERRAYPDWRKWLVLRTGEPVFPSAPQVAAKLIAEIEKAAAKPLAELSEPELFPYHRRIDEIMSARHAREHPYPDPIGERLLEELRRDYSGPHWQAVA